VTTERGITALLIAAMLFFAGTATAQYAQRPFFDDTLRISQAYGFELALLRLEVLDLVGDDLDDDYLEVIEGFDADLRRFMGSVARADADLAEELEEAVEEVEEAAEDGEVSGEAVAEARELLQQAYDLVVPADVRSDPAFAAALIVELSLGEGGVGEGYEEATEGELGAYTMGYVSLARVVDLWDAVVAPAADEQHRADVEEMWEFLDTLYPEATIEDAIVGNPEEAEAPVQRVIGLLEAIVDAELFPGRDLFALSAQLPEQLAGYCEAYDAGDDDLAVEGVIAVGYLYFSADLASFLSFMAPEVHEEASEQIVALTGLEPELEGVEEEEEEDEDEDEEEFVPVEDPAAACRELLEALQEAHEALGG